MEHAISSHRIYDYIQTTCRDTKRKPLSLATRRLILPDLIVSLQRRLSHHSGRLRSQRPSFTVDRDHVFTTLLPIVYPDDKKFRKNSKDGKEVKAAEEAQDAKETSNTLDAVKMQMADELTATLDANGHMTAASLEWAREQVLAHFNHTRDKSADEDPFHAHRNRTYGGQPKHQHQKQKQQQQGDAHRSHRQERHDSHQDPNYNAAMDDLVHRLKTIKLLH